jgi:hypothetical protein
MTGRSEEQPHTRQVLRWIKCISTFLRPILDDAIFFAPICNAQTSRQIHALTEAEELAVKRQGPTFPRKVAVPFLMVEFSVGFEEFSCSRTLLMNRPAPEMKVNRVRQPHPRSPALTVRRVIVVAEITVGPETGVEVADLSKDAAFVEAEILRP